MTTDTAVRVTRLIVQDKGKQFHPKRTPFLIDFIVALDKIDYVDYPELRINKNESTEMPFRYVKGSNGEPIMPEVSRALVPLQYP
jgi:ribosome biogenesis SPOUT family RNA methylase Rps3